MLTWGKLVGAARLTVSAHVNKSIALIYQETNPYGLESRFFYVSNPPTMVLYSRICPFFPNSLTQSFLTAL
jgi:hypothetical protein